MAKKENIKSNKNKQVHSTGNRFQSVLITVLVLGFISLVCLVFYFQEIGKIHLPENVLYVLASAIAILIVRSYHIMIKARFNNN